MIIVITWTHAVVVESSAGGEVAQLLRGGRRVVHHRRPQTRHRQLGTNIFLKKNFFVLKLSEHQHLYLTEKTSPNLFNYSLSQNDSRRKNTIFCSKFQILESALAIHYHRIKNIY